ncbi:MAG: ABC transporter permease [Actinomycetota bacterium]|nr:ABC transporter permease [Actinomycetota bacterium]
MSTRRYLLSKLGQALLTLAFVLAFNFFLFRGIGDPLNQLLRGARGGISPAALERLQKELGLNLPLPQQFVHYLGQTLQGHLGLSYFYNIPVRTVIAQRIWPTVLLVGTSTIASTVFGIWIGIAQGWRRGSAFDQSMLGFTLFTYAMPEFWFGLLMIMAFSVGVGFFPAIFPTGGYDTTGVVLTGISHLVDVLNHMVLPFVVLTIAYLGEYSLIMRSSLLETLGEDFIVLARAKGMREKRILRKHAVPNALLPTMTVTILGLGFVISGAITIELIFNWPGLGLLTDTAILNRDFPVLQGMFLLFSGAVIVANLIADLLYSYLDPRVRAG